MTVAYIYFDYEGTTNQSPVNLIGSLLRQLLQRKGFIPEQIRALYNQNSTEETRLTLTEIVNLLKLECLSDDKTFIVIDALDESVHYDSTRDTFIDALSKLPPTTRLMLTSRTDVTIAKRLSGIIKLEI
jgi:hypothetical protein